MKHDANYGKTTFLIALNILFC